MTRLESISVSNIAPAIFDAAFAIASQSTSSFEVADESKSRDDAVTRRDAFLEMANQINYGGEVDLDHLPELLDTLPAIAGDTTLLLIPGDASEEGGEDSVPHTLDDEVSTSGKKEAASDSDNELPAATEPAKRTNDASTEIVFADADESEAYGGELAMPEALVQGNGVDSPPTLLLDTDLPAAQEIDQIISQAPMIELGSETGQSDSDEPEPISINLRASLPIAILCLPAVKRKAAKNPSKKDDSQRYSS